MGWGTAQRYYCDLGGTLGDIGAVKWGFMAAPKIYDSIGAPLGVTQIADNNAAGVLYGANKPRPARVRIAYKIGTGGGGGTGGTANDKSASVIRFCTYDNLGQVLFGSMNQLKVTVLNPSDGTVKTHDIDSVTIKGNR